jgi:hypothetical protein
MYTNKFERQIIFSIFFGEKNGGTRSVGLGDDPDFHSASERISRQDASAFSDGSIIGLLVFVADLAPIASGMTPEKLQGRLACLTQRLHRPWCGDGLAEKKSFWEKLFRGVVGDHERCPFYGKRNLKIPLG